MGSGLCCGGELSSVPATPGSPDAMGQGGPQGSGTVRESRGVVCWLGFLGCVHWILLVGFLELCALDFTFAVSSH